MAIIVRPAMEEDQETIRALVRGERLNPTKLDWPNFLVAADERGNVIGAVQMRRHPDGSRELGSLVVSKTARGRGVATRLVEALLTRETERVQMVTDGAFADHYARWGFRRITPRAASKSVRLNYRIGRAAIVLSFLKRRPYRRLVILDRPAFEPMHRLVREPLRLLPPPPAEASAASAFAADRVDNTPHPRKTPVVPETARLATNVITFEARTAASADRVRVRSKTSKTTR